MKQLLCSFILLFTLSLMAGAQDKNAPVKIEGQIVCCEDCWARADRRTTPYGTVDDVAKAARCIANGDPSLLAVTQAEGATTMYELVSGRFQRPGKNWQSFIGKRVEITGTVSSKKNRRLLKVDALTVLASQSDAPNQATPDVIGSQVELVLKDLFGVEQKLSSYRGRIVVLNFWATYCIPCRREMPDLAAIQNQFAALGVQVIGASSDTLEERAKVYQFIRETRLNFPVWLGATAADMTSFGLGSALPGTVIIGRDGKVLAQFRGVIKQSDLKRRLDALLALATPEVKEQIHAARPKPGEASSVPS